MTTPSDTSLEPWLNNLITSAYALASRGQEHMQVSCEHMPVQGSHANLPSHRHWSPLLLACLAAAGIKNLYIPDFNNCPDCGDAQAQLNKTQQAYEALASATTVHLSLHRATMPTPPLPKQDEPVSRRTFFRTFLPGMAKQAAQHLTQLNLQHTPNLTEILQQDERPIPVINKLFLHALPKLGINHTPVPAMPLLALGNIQASEACTACGECVACCKSHALSLRPFGQRNILEFQASHCIGCRQCVDICPEQALESLPSINVPSLLQEKPRPLVMVGKVS